MAEGTCIVPISNRDAITYTSMVPSSKITVNTCNIQIVGRLVICNFSITANENINSYTTLISNIPRALTGIDMIALNGTSVSRAYVAGDSLGCRSSITSGAQLTCSGTYILQ